MSSETIRLDANQIARIEAAAKDLNAAGIASKLAGDAAKATLDAVQRALANRDQLIRDLGLTPSAELDRRLDQVESALAGGEAGARLGGRIGALGGPAGRLVGSIAGGLTGTLGGVVVGSERARFRREVRATAGAYDDALFAAGSRLRGIVGEAARLDAEARARRELAVRRARKVR